MTIRLFNTLSKSVEDLVPLRDGLVRIYSCGPTVYNHAHIGNMRSFLSADLLQRVCRVVGRYDVQWVMNITDIDDKTIRDSAPGSEQWRPEMGGQTSDPIANLRAFTSFYSATFIEDISVLGIDPAQMLAMPRATEFIPQMQELIRRILHRGVAYVADGSVYFDLRAWRSQAAYGRLFAVDTENFRDGVRIDADEYERDSVSDFVLWKAKKDGEPAWDFTVTVDGVETNLPGRPGWHIECSAMGKELLGLPFDIHTGGVDLRFPHHEDEIAQSEAGYGVDPARMWCHNEFLEVEGKKMSKSLGNYFTLRDLLARGYDARDIRYALMSGHYSSVLNFTFDGLAAAAKARARVQEVIHDVWSASGTATYDIAPVRAAVMGALADNLHTPRALAALFTGLAAMAAAPASQLDGPSREAVLQFFRDINDVFAVWDITERPVAQAHAIPDNVLRLAQERWEAKQARDFVRADALRADITAAGWLMKDRKDGFDLEPVSAG